MAGSPTYLALLDGILATSPFDPVDGDKTASWEAIDACWNMVVRDPSERNLGMLAVQCYRRYAVDRGLSMADVILTAKNLHIAKNAGYAGADNPDPWANFRLAANFGVSPVEGVYVRMSDKYIRTTNLRANPANERVGESLLDTLADLAAYSLIAICLLREERLDA